MFLWIIHVNVNVEINLKATVDLNQIFDSAMRDRRRRMMPAGRLRVLRGKGEDYSDVILRLAAEGG